MVLQYDQPSASDERLIRELIGLPFSWKKRFKDCPIGSPRLDVAEFSPHFSKHFGNRVDQKFISIERREKGILVYIRNPLNNYVWAIPYYQLSLFKSDTFNLHANGLFVRVKIAGAKPSVKKFLDKMMEARIAFLEK